MSFPAVASFPAIAAFPVLASYSDTPVAEVAEITEITCGANVARSLHGKSFTIYDELGSRGVYYNCGAQSEITDVDFTGLAGADFVTAGDGKFLRIMHGGTLATYWFDTGTENAPGMDTLTKISINVFDDAPAIAAAFAAQALTGGGLTSANPTANVARMTDSSTGPQTDATADNSGAVVTVFQQGEDAAIPPGGVDSTIGVALNSDDTDDGVASATQSVLDGYSSGSTGWSISRSVAILTVTDLATGPRADATDVDTGFGISVIQQGS